MSHLTGMDVGHYLAVKDRVASLVLDSDPERRVPGSPAWRVRDVVAHLAGLCDDWVGHRLDGYASESWTNAQVIRFAAYPLDEILGRWNVSVRAFASLRDDPTMGAPARWAFGDAVIHEADLRGALGVGRVPDEAMSVALQGAISRWRHQLNNAKTPTLLVRATDLPRVVDRGPGRPGDGDGGGSGLRIVPSLGRTPDTRTGALMGLGRRTLAISRCWPAISLSLGRLRSQRLTAPPPRDKRRTGNSRPRTCVEAFEGHSPSEHPGGDTCAAKPIRPAE